MTQDEIERYASVTSEVLYWMSRDNMTGVKSKVEIGNLIGELYLQLSHIEKMYALTADDIFGNIAKSIRTA